MAMTLRIITLAAFAGGTPDMADALTPHDALLACRDVAGSDSALARALDVSQPTVWRWINQTRQMPAEYVLRAEAATGVSRHYLRPDIYPVEVHALPPRFLGVDRGAVRVSFNRAGVSKQECAA